MYKNRLKDIRISNNIKQEDVAKFISLETQTYTNYENECYIMPIKHLNNVVEYFNISFDYIFEFNTQKRYINHSLEISKKIAGKRLREFRVSIGFTQLKLAKLLHTSQSVIANYERGRTIISTPFLYTICSEFKVSADYLLGKVNDDFIRTTTEDIMDNILNIFTS